jgi:predicted nucleic acid-binding protein
MIFTIDASIFLSSCNKTEKDSSDSLDFLNLIKKHETLIVEPTLMPVEVAASIRRGCGSNQLAVEYAELILNLPHAIFVQLDNDFSRKAAKIASEYSLRGADSIYMTVALQYGSILVSLDKEQLDRAPSTVKACPPKMAGKHLLNGL